MQNMNNMSVNTVVDYCINTTTLKLNHKIAPTSLKTLMQHIQFLCFSFMTTL